jgi:hypothetical protein
VKVAGGREAVEYERGEVERVGRADFELLRTSSCWDEGRSGGEARESEGEARVAAGVVKESAGEFELLLEPELEPELEFKFALSKCRLGENNSSTRFRSNSECGLLT